MTTALRAGAALLVGATLVACNGGGNKNNSGPTLTPDEQAINGLMDEFFGAFEDGDADKLASLFSTECGELNSLAESVIATFQGAGEDVHVELDSVEITELTPTTAKALPKGTIVNGDERTPLSEDTDQPEALVKENGEWKIAQCDLFL